MPRILARLIVLFCLLPAVACKSQQEVPVLRVALLPEETRTSALDRYAPLFDHLESSVGKRIEVIFPADYEELLEIFHQGKVDLARFGGYTFVKANLADQAMPLVMGMGDSRSTSLVIVRKEDPAKVVADLKGKRLAFGSPLSTAGHMMPRFFFEEQGIHPETFFSEIHYFGNHNNSAAMVLSDQADVAVGSSAILSPLLKSGQLNGLRILWETPSFTNYVWATPKGMSTALFTRLRLAFLSLSLDREKDYHALAPLNSSGFLPADLNDFAPLFAIEAAWEKRG